MQPPRRRRAIHLLGAALVAAVLCGAQAPAPPSWLGVTLGPASLLAGGPRGAGEAGEAGDAGLAGGTAAEDAPRGALVTGVVRDSPADRAGLRGGDLVVRLGAAAVDSPGDLQRAVAALTPGEWTDVEVARRGQRRTVSVRLGTRSESTGSLDVRRPWLGATGLDVPLQLREQWGGDERRGVLVGEVDPAGPGARGGLRPGDLVLSVDGWPVGNRGELAQRVQLGGVGNTVELEVSRQGTLLTLEVELDDVPPPDLRAPDRAAAPRSPAPRSR